MSPGSLDEQPSIPATLEMPGHDATLAARAQPPHVSGYEIETELGRGAMGVVYKARQLALNRIVALKMILHADHANAEDRRRFQMEAQALARLKHPNIVQIYEVGEHQGQPFFALEFVEGGTLAERSKRQALSVIEAAQLTAILARTVHAAHESRVVHRDLKPANILLAADGTPKISDFGLAKHLDAETVRTQSGAIFGTPAYMAPEQACGRIKDIGPAADIYALGAILYELLAGHVPFRGLSGLDVLQQVQTEEPVSLRSLVAKMPRDLETICQKCLRKSIESRYQSALELAEDLERFLRGEPIRARPVPAWERILKWARRHPAPATLAVFILLAVVSAIAAGAFFTAYLGQALAQRTEELRSEQQARESEAKQRQRELRRELYLTGIQQAAQLCQLGEISPCFDLLARHLPKEGEEDQRDFAWHYYQRWCDRRQAKIDSKQGMLRCLAFAPNGKLLASGGADGTIKLWDASGGLHAVFGEGSAAVAALAFADETILVAVRDDGSVQRWDVVRRQRIAWPSVHQGDGTILTIGKGGYTLSAQGDLLANRQPDTVVRLWDLRQGIQRGQLRADSRGPSALNAKQGLLAVTQDQGIVSLQDLTLQRERVRIAAGRPITTLTFAHRAPILALGDVSGSVTFWQTATGERLGEWQRQRSPLHVLVFAPDDRTLAAATADGSIDLWDLANQREPARYRGHKADIYCLAFTPDGRLLASGGADQTIQLWDGWVAAEPASLNVAIDSAGPIVFAPDGKLLAVLGLDRTIRLLDRESGRLRATFRSCLAGWREAAFSPSGSQLAAAGDDRHVHLWELAAGSERRLAGHDDTVTCVAYSPDGQWLASGAADHYVKLWKMPSGQLQHTLSDHNGAILKLAFSPDGKLLATASADKSVKLWSVPTFQRQLELRPQRKILDLAFSPDGQTLLLCSEGVGLSFWNVRTGKETISSTGIGAQAKHFALSSSGARLAVSSSNEVWIWDLPSQKRHAILRHGNWDGEARWLAFAPDGKTLAVNHRGGALVLWDVDAWKVAGPIEVHPSSILSVAFSPSGQTLATGSSDSEDNYVHLFTHLFGREVGGGRYHAADKAVRDYVRFWDVPGFTPRAEKLPEDEKTLTGHPLVAFAPDGTCLASGGKDGSIALWDMASGKRRVRLFVSARAKSYLETVETGRKLSAIKPDFNRSEIRALAFAPDSRLLAAASDEGEIKLFDPASGSERAALPGKHAEVSCLAFDSDGALLATNNREVIELWDIPQDGPPVLSRQLAGHSASVRCLAFCKQNQMLASGSEDGEICLWYLLRDEPPRLLRGHIGRVSSLAFSVDGKTLASASWDGTVRLWHMDAERELVTLLRGINRIHAVAFSPDGRILAAGGERANGRGDVHFWKAAQ